MDNARWNSTGAEECLVTIRQHKNKTDKAQTSKVLKIETLCEVLLLLLFALLQQISATIEIERDRRGKVQTLVLNLQTQ